MKTKIFLVALLVTIWAANKWENDLERAGVSILKGFDYLDFNGCQVFNAQFGPYSGDLYYQSANSGSSASSGMTIIVRESLDQKPLWTTSFIRSPVKNMFLVDHQEKYVYFTTERKNSTIMFKLDAEKGTPLTQTVLSTDYECNKSNWKMILSQDDKDLYYFTTPGGDYTSKFILWRFKIHEGGFTLCVWADREYVIDFQTLEASNILLLISSALDGGFPYKPYYNLFSKLEFNEKDIDIKWRNMRNRTSDYYPNNNNCSSFNNLCSIFIKETGVIYTISNWERDFEIVAINSTDGSVINSESVTMYVQNQINKWVYAKGVIPELDKFVISLEYSSIMVYQLSTKKIESFNTTMYSPTLLYNYYTDNLYVLSSKYFERNHCFLSVHSLSLIMHSSITEPKDENAQFILKTIPDKYLIEYNKTLEVINRDLNGEMSIPKYSEEVYPNVIRENVQVSMTKSTDVSFNIRDRVIYVPENSYSEMPIMLICSVSGDTEIKHSIVKEEGNDEYIVALFGDTLSFDMPRIQEREGFRFFIASEIPSLNQTFLKQILVVIQKCEVLECQTCSSSNKQCEKCNLGYSLDLNPWSSDYKNICVTSQQKSQNVPILYRGSEFIPYDELVEPINQKESSESNTKDSTTTNSSVEVPNNDLPNETEETQPAKSDPIENSEGNQATKPAEVDILNDIDEGEKDTEAESKNSSEGSDSKINVIILLLILIILLLIIAIIVLVGLIIWCLSRRNKKEIKSINKAVETEIKVYEEIKQNRGPITTNDVSINVINRIDEEN